MRSGAARGRDYAYLLVLLATGIVVNMVYSRMGFMPLDHSIVFDGGWRILNGQVPWRDFMTPSAVVPAAMQAALFAVLGVNWFAYCLHASVVNGLFAALLYILLVIMRLPRPLAFFYGVCATFFFYPPIGVPYMEQHSFFFTLAAITCAVAGNYAESGWTQKILWASVPVLALLAFFSKQVPFVFAAVSLPVIMTLPGRSPVRTRVLLFAAAAAACLALLFALGLILRVHRADFIDYVFVRPVLEGRGRFVSWTGPLVHAIGRSPTEPARMGLTFAREALGLYLAGVIALPFAWPRAIPRSRESLNDISRACCALVLAPVAYVSSMLLLVVTHNQGEECIAFYPVAAGLVHAALWAELRAWRVGRAAPADDGKRPSTGEAKAAQGTRGLAVLLSPRSLLGNAAVVAVVVVSIVPIRNWTLDTVHFGNNVDATRVTNDMRFSARLAARSASQLPAGMEFLRWTVPDRYHLEGWAGLISFLRSHDGNVLIIGDNLVTYALARKPSIAPNLWFHPGLAMPAPGERAFARYEYQLISRIQHDNVRYVVVEGAGTWLGIQIGHLARLNAWLTSSWCQTRNFGDNRVFERCEVRETASRPTGQ
jgi:hypothetical protein